MVRRHELLVFLYDFFFLYCVARSLQILDVNEGPWCYVQDVETYLKFKIYLASSGVIFGANPPGYTRFATSAIAFGLFSPTNLTTLVALYTASPAINIAVPCFVTKHNWMSRWPYRSSSDRSHSFSKPHKQTTPKVIHTYKAIIARSRCSSLYTSTR